jgi:hypothetical protein
MPCPTCAAHRERADQSDASANEAEAKLRALLIYAATLSADAALITLRESRRQGALSYHEGQAVAMDDAAHEIRTLVGELP